MWKDKRHLERIIEMRGGGKMKEAITPTKVAYKIVWGDPPKDNKVRYKKKKIE